MTDSEPRRRVASDAPFMATCTSLAALYVGLVVAMLVADVAFFGPDEIPDDLGALTGAGWWCWETLSRLATAVGDALGREEIRRATILSLASSTMTTILALWSAIPLGYLMARTDFRGKRWLDSLLDVPIVLPPLVVGLSLLVLFQTPLGRMAESITPFTYAVPGVIVAQYAVAAAFAVRIMRATFERMDPRREQVALTLGCTRSQAFFRVVLPEARPGVVTAATLAWARSLGEFGPVLVFAGAMPMRTEVLPTSVFLELSIGDIEAAVAISLIMVATAACVLIATRRFASAPGRDGA